MAERLGLLAGPHLSEVAMLGVRLLTVADEQAKAEERGWQVRLALLGAGGEPRQLFPEVFAQAQESDRAEEADVSQVYDRVDWTVPSADDWARTQALLANDQIRVSTPDGGWV